MFQLKCFIFLAKCFTVQTLSYRIDINMLEAESLDNVFIDLESEAILRTRVAEMKGRLDQKPRSHSVSSSTSDCSLRTKVIRLLSSMSDEV